MNPANILAYFAQVALLVTICAGLPRVLGLRSATLQHVFWRTLLAACLLLPFVEPRRPHDMAFVPAPAQPLAVARSATPPAPVTPSTPPFDWFRAVRVVAIAGISLRFGWMSVGLARLRRLRRRAKEQALGFDDLRSAIGADAPILWSPDATHPVTFGVIRPVVLLPSALKTVDAAAQRAVVAHELHHVKRRDWLWTMGEEVVRAIFWFHPAMWWLISRVQLARETVVDELSILTTNARRAYLDALLAFADDSGPLNIVPTPAFSARRHLFHRIMLLSKEGGMSSIRVAASSCVLAIALGAGSWGAVSAFPLRQDQAPAINLRTLAPVTVSFKDADLATVLRLFEQITHMKVVFDPALNRRVTIEIVDQPWDKVLGQILETHGLAFDVKDNTIRVGRSAAIPPPPPPPPPRAGEIRRNSADIPPPPPAPPSSSQMLFVPESYERHMRELMPIRVGANVRPPTKIRDVKPVYPPEALSRRVQGAVIIEALIDPDGLVADARVLRSIPPLDAAALDAVRQWKYTPTLMNGVPTALVITLTVNFTLE